MNKPQTLLIVENAKDSACPTIERALRQTMHQADTHCVSDCVELNHYLERKGRWETEPGPIPNLICIDLDPVDAGAFASLRALKQHPDLRRIPVIAFLRAESHAFLAACYDIGVNSVVERPACDKAFEERLKILCDYWFDHVELPTPR